MSQVDIVCKLLTMSHVQAGHGRVSMGGLVSDTEDEGDEDVAGSQVMGSQGGVKAVRSLWRPTSLRCNIFCCWKS